MADFAETTGGGTALEESSLVGPRLTSASGEPILGA